LLSHDNEKGESSPAVSRETIRALRWRNTNGDNSNTHKPRLTPQHPYGVELTRPFTAQAIAVAPAQITPPATSLRTGDSLDQPEEVVDSTRVWHIETSGIGA